MERFQTLLDLSHGLCLQKLCFSEFKWTKKISANVKKKKSSVSPTISLRCMALVM